MILIDKSRLCSAFTLSLFVFNFSTARAETLEHAWQLAIEKNHRIKSAKAATGASEQQLYSAQGQRLPELKITGGYTQFSTTPAVQTDISGFSAQFPTSQAGSGRAEAMVSIPVYTSGRISHAINAAEAALQAAKHNETASVQDIKLQVAETYIEVLRAESALEVAQSHVDSLAAHAQDVNNLYSQGMVARNDLLSAQVELANARQRTVQVANQLDITRAAYNRLLDRPLAHPVALTNLHPALPQGELSQLNQSALQHRPELALFSQRIESLQQQAESTQSELLPQLSVNGGYQYQQNRYQVHEGMWQVNVDMQWKLFDGGTRHKSSAIMEQAMALKEQRDDLRSNITMQVRQAWLNIEETRKRIAVNQAAIDQAEENMKVTTARYRQDLSTQTDVLKAEDLRTLTYDHFNNARYDHKLAILRLRWSLGIL